MNTALVLLALLGHAFWCVAMVNQVHATSVPQWAAKLTLLAGMMAMAAFPVALGWWVAAAGLDPMDVHLWWRLPGPVLAYVALCWIAAPWVMVRWVWWRMTLGPPAILRAHRSHLVELLTHPDPPAGEDHDHHFLVRLPGNQMLHLDVCERSLNIAGLPERLDRLSMIHLSDLHFTGRVGKAYFREVARRSNELEPDLVAITGDIADDSRYIDWIPDILGKIRARWGVYFILGNHDFRIDWRRILAAMADCGLVYLGGRWTEIRVRGVPLLLAGNELPWSAPAADLAGAPPPLDQGGPPRIALAHSPDQIDWARANRIDLLLAGHLHGGQIRLPLIGPVLSPSRRGVKYASGTFHDPPTIMHVSRGISGEIPLRFNCAPEMAKLVLHATR